MLGFRPLPWEYGVRNLFRRPTRSGLTLVCLTLVVLLVFVVVGFIRGLERSLADSGDPQVVLVHSLGSSENVENSTVPRGTETFLATIPAVQKRTLPDGSHAAYASPELYLGTNIKVEGDPRPTMGLVRGVTPAALLVRSRMQLLQGTWPKAGEVVVGRLAATKLGREGAALAIGRQLTFEGREWRISGHFAAAGSALESEVWCPLEDLHQATKRTDGSVSIIALGMRPGGRFSEIDNICRERLDLELAATPETAYYESLQRHYRPVRMLGWLIVGLVASAGVFAGLNTMYGAVVGRVRELATLQTLGFSRRAIALSLMQESVVLSAAASLVAAALALCIVNGVAVRFTMGAFTLRIDSVALLIGCGVGLLLGVVGSIPPALRAMQMLIAEGLKAV